MIDKDGDWVGGNIIQGDKIGGDVVRGDKFVVKQESNAELEKTYIAVVEMYTSFCDEKMDHCTTLTTRSLPEAIEQLYKEQFPDGKIYRTEHFINTYIRMYEVGSPVWEISERS